MTLGEPEEQTAKGIIRGFRKSGLRIRPKWILKTFSE